MIEEIILGLVGLAFIGRNKFSWEEVIGVSLGCVFVVAALLIVGHLMPEQERLNCFIRLMVFGYLPMRLPVVTKKGLSTGWTKSRLAGQNQRMATVRKSIKVFA